MAKKVYTLKVWWPDRAISSTGKGDESYPETIEGATKVDIDEGYACWTDKDGKEVEVTNIPVCCESVKVKKEKDDDDDDD